MLDIEPMIWKVKRALQIRFWQAIYDSLVEGLKNKKLDEQWNLKTTADPFKDPIKPLPSGQEPGFCCDLRNPDNSPPRIRATLGFLDKKFRISVGFVDGRPKEVPAEVNTLLESLKLDQFQQPADMTTLNWWIAVKDCDVDLTAKEFLIDVASDLGLLVDKIVDSFTELLQKRGQALQAADRALG